MNDPLLDLTPEELAALDRAELEAAAEPSLRETLPKVCLHPEWWCPPVIHQPQRMHPLRRAYRRENRPYRRAFGGGERRRSILLKVAEARIKDAER